MTNTNGQHANAPTVDTDEVEELQADIARTREQLAATVDQLTAKLDVKTRLRGGVARAVEAGKSSATDRARSLRRGATSEDGRPTPATLSVASGLVAAVAAVVAVRLWLRPGRRRRPTHRQRPARPGRAPRRRRH